jgi:hypothetical protein
MAADDQNKQASGDQIVDAAKRLFYLENKLNPVSLVGLVIALLTATCQLYLYFQGPDLAVLQPEQIDISHDSNGNLVITARVAHVNNGGTGYNDIVKKETLRFRLPSENNPQITETFQLTWQYFVRYVQDSNGSIRPEFTQSAQPAVIHAQSVETHETQFYPRTVQAVEPYAAPVLTKIPLEEFKRRIAKMKELEITIHAHYVHSAAQSARCTLMVDDNLIQRLRIGRIVSPVCW